VTGTFSCAFSAESCSDMQGPPVPLYKRSPRQPQNTETPDDLLTGADGREGAIRR
jgi:hypothetical protein